MGGGPPLRWFFFWGGAGGSVGVLRGSEIAAGHMFSLFFVFVGGARGSEE